MQELFNVDVVWYVSSFLNLLQEAGNNPAGRFVNVVPSKIKPAKILLFSTNVAELVVSVFARPLILFSYFL
jgi:hypothetical protein